MPAAAFISDITRPALRGFSLNLNTSVLTLNFTEAMDDVSLDPSGITLRSENATNATSAYTLTNGTVISIDQTIVEIEVTRFDLNNIKAVLDLATDIADTYIDIREGSILDTSGNPVLGTSPEDAIPVTELRPDVTNPELLGFDLDIDSGCLTMTFSETVLPTSLDPTAFTIQNSDSLTLENGSLFYTLTGGNVTVIQNTVLKLKMPNTDLNQLKRRSLLATSDNDSFLSITEDAVTDSSGNSVIPVPSAAAVAVSNYTEDTTLPELLSFNLDLNIGQLLLRFSETVNSSTLNLPFFTFQNSCPSPLDFANETNATNSTNSTETDFDLYTLTGN